MGGERGALNFHLKARLHLAVLWIDFRSTNKATTLCHLQKIFLFEHQFPDFAYLERLAGLFPLDNRLLSSGCISKSFLLGKLPRLRRRDLPPKQPIFNTRLSFVKHWIFWPPNGSRGLFVRWNQYFREYLQYWHTYLHLRLRTFEWLGMDFFPQGE